MRKLLATLFMACFTVAAMAQEETVTEKHSVATNSFWSNWFIQGGVEWSTWYSSYEDGKGYAKSPFKSFRANPNVSLAIGKWFTPGIGLRTKAQGIWGKSVFTDNCSDNENKYWMLNEHVMLNFSNLFFGYNPNRVWSFIPFAGAGIGRSMTYNRYAMGLSLGLLNEFRVSRKLSVNFELGWNRYESDICGMSPAYGSGWFKSHANNIYAEVGLTVKLGKGTWNKVPDVEAINAMSQSQLDALNAQLSDAQAENDRLRSELRNKPEAQTTVEKEFYTVPVSVFFELNKTKIASRKDLVNVKSLAEYAKENGATLVVTGYADSATGSAEYNANLSEKRAQVVADELVKLGVKKENIKVQGKGGVDTLSPFGYNRRATVEVSK